MVVGRDALARATDSPGTGNSSVDSALAEDRQTAPAPTFTARWATTSVTFPKPGPIRECSHIPQDLRCGPSWEPANQGASEVCSGRYPSTIRLLLKPTVEVAGAGAAFAFGDATPEGQGPERRS